MLFVSVFFDFYVFSAEKYAIDAYLNDAASGYFNIIFMPTSMINLAAGFVIRPVLTALTDAWNGRDWEKFDGTLRRISFIIAGLCVFESVLLCAGDHAETEDDLRYLRGDDCDRGSDLTGICESLWDSGGGVRLSASDASDDRRIFLL